MEQQGGGGLSKRTAYMIGGGILLLGIGFFVFKKIKAKRKYAMGDNDRYTSNNNNSSNNSSSSSSSSTSSGGGGFDPSYASGQLYKSMKGMGTDDDLFFSTARGLSKDERQKVKEHFNTNYGELKDWIEDDFSFGDEDDALALFGY